MARYDKYDGSNGNGFRAALAADRITAPFSRPIAVGLDTSGRVVVGAGNTGIVGILVTTKRMLAGTIVDVMVQGEIVEFDPVTAGTLGVAGTNFTALTTTGVMGVTAADATHSPVGFTAEAGRLIVNCKAPGGGF